MFDKNTKSCALRGLALTVFSAGSIHAAVTLNIYELAGRTHFEFDGGTLDLSPSQVSVPLVNSTTANEVSAAGGSSGAIGVNSLYSGATASGSFTAFAAITVASDVATWAGTNNLTTVSSTYEGGTWGLIAGDGLDITVSNNGDPFSDFFTSSAIIDAHQSIPGGLAANGFMIGDTRTITIGESNDTYTINVVAVPEPSASLLMSVACGFLTFRRKKTN